jgi:hypothetical protein
MEKYYTPKIEEFYVGFECEFLDRGNNSWNSVVLTYEILSQVLVFPLKGKQYGFLSYIKSELSSGNVRVKCLDKEDIESFGFKDHKGDTHTYEKEYIISFLVWNGRDEYNIHYNTKSREIKKILHTAGLCKMFNCFFPIKVKNKSELRVLLKQLNIL